MYFMHIDIEYSEECAADAIKVRKGDHIRNEVLATFCGQGCEPRGVIDDR